ADKLEAALEKAIKNLTRKAGSEVKIKKSTYRGAVLRQVVFGERGFPFRPTYTIHKGWLAVALYPQPVQGFVARSQGELKSWKPSPKVEESLKALPKEFVSISYSDPRPGLKLLLSVAPLIASAIDSASQDLNFDVASLPSAQAFTEHLFPNVSVTTDD